MIDLSQEPMSMRISPRAYARLALPALALATLSLAGPLARAAAPAE